MTDSQRRDLDLELQAARAVQQSLLPESLPRIDQASLAFRYHPVHDLSGDFLDFYYSKQHNRLGFFMCDVSGHGVAAALIASMVKMSLHLWGEYLDDPVGTLNKIHRSLHNKMCGNFITAVIGSLNLDNGTMVSARAGHTPMMIRRKNGLVEEVDSGGTLIHEFVEPRFIRHETVLEPGEKLFIFTDGLFEIRNRAGLLLGEEGLLKLVAASGERDPDQSCQAVFEAIDTYADGDESFLDDTSLMVIQYTPGPA